MVMAKIDNCITTTEIEVSLWQSHKHVHDKHFFACHSKKCLTNKMCLSSNICRSRQMNKQLLDKQIPKFVKQCWYLRGVLPIFVSGGVRMEGKIQTQKHGFAENFAPKNIGILHISHLKIW